MMKPDRPDNLEEQLSAYLDGELSDAEQAEVQAFLAENEDARRLLADLKRNADLLHALPRARAPDGLLELITAQVERDELLGGAPAASSGSRAPVWGVGRWLASAAVILLAASAGYLTFTHLREGASRPGQPTIGPLADAGEKQRGVSEKIAPPDEGPPAAVDREEVRRGFSPDAGTAGVSPKAKANGSEARVLRGRAAKAARDGVPVVAKGDHPDGAPVPVAEPPAAVPVAPNEQFGYSVEKRGVAIDKPRSVDHLERTAGAPAGEVSPAPAPPPSVSYAKGEGSGRYGQYFDAKSAGSAAIGGTFAASESRSAVPDAEQGARRLGGTGEAFEIALAYRDVAARDAAATAIEHTLREPPRSSWGLGKEAADASPEDGSAHGVASSQPAARSRVVRRADAGATLLLVEAPPSGARAAMKAVQEIGSRTGPVSVSAQAGAAQGWAAVRTLGREYLASRGEVFPGAPVSQTQMGLEETPAPVLRERVSATRTFAEQSMTAKVVGDAVTRPTVLGRHDEQGGLTASPTPAARAARPSSVPAGPSPSRRAAAVHIPAPAANAPLRLEPTTRQGDASAASMAQVTSRMSAEDQQEGRDLFELRIRLVALPEAGIHQPVHAATTRAATSTPAE